MKLLFVDTSSLFKFYYPEPGSAEVERVMLAAECIAISELSRVEFLSVAVRKVRTGELSRDHYALLASSFDEDCLAGAYRVIGLNGEVANEARSLLDRLGMQHGLRTLDSLQLASALRAGADGFLCHDTRLVELAEYAGLKIMG